MISESIIAALFLVNYGYVETGPNPLTIIRGNETNKTYRFLVSVEIKTSGVDYCAGSIISPIYVITAAHCVHDLNADDIIVIVGCTNSDEGETELQIDILEPIFEHPYYNNATLENDISLLLLNGTLSYTPSVGAIRLGEGPLPLGTVIRAIGFGESEIENDIEYVYMLKEVNLKIETNNICERLYGITIGSQICAENEIMSLTKRDAGSPVLYGQQLIGMVSLTEKDEEGSGYTVLVYIPDYLDFILGIMNQYS